MKKFYQENRVFVILMGIALVCIAVIIVMATSYIISTNSSDTYGNRLDGISDVEIADDKITEMSASITEMEKVQDVTINVHGKIVYFTVDFENDTTVDEAKNIAVLCLDFFDTEYLNFYDLQFLFTKSDSEESEETFPIIGYIKAGASTISWSNNAN